MRSGLRDDNFAINIFSNIFKFLFPSFNIDIVKNKSMARVGFVASDDTWCQNHIFSLNVSESNISNRDSWLGFAWFEWIDHTSWSSSTWLFLLLWSDINVPPNRFVNDKIFIQDV